MQCVLDMEARREETAWKNWMYIMPVYSVLLVWQDI